MGNKNIIFNHTLEEYKKKYRNRNYRLLSFSKKEVEDYDNTNHRNDKFLLRNKKWWLIKDTYFEIPKPIRFTWFRNLNAGVQVVTCLLGAGAIATAGGLIIWFSIFNNFNGKVNAVEWNESIENIVNYKKNNNLNYIAKGELNAVRPFGGNFKIKEIEVNNKAGIQRMRVNNDLESQNDYDHLYYKFNDFLNFQINEFPKKGIVYHYVEEKATDYLNVFLDLYDNYSYFKFDEKTKRYVSSEGELAKFTIEVEFNRNRKISKIILDYKYEGTYIVTSLKGSLDFEYGNSNIKTKNEYSTKMKNTTINLTSKENHLEGSFNNEGIYVFKIAKGLIKDDGLYKLSATDKNGKEAFMFWSDKWGNGGDTKVYKDGVLLKEDKDYELTGQTSQKPFKVLEFKTSIKDSAIEIVVKQEQHGEGLVAPFIAKLTK